MADQRTEARLMSQSEMEERLASLSRMTEENRPKLMLELNRFSLAFGPVPLTQSYREIWLIDKLLAAQNWHKEQLSALENTISIQLNNFLVEMKPDYDDSIAGFNEASNIVRAAFKKWAR
jgi:hypothetical protein